VGAPSAFQRHHRVAPERSANESARCRGRERVVTNLGREFGRFGNLPVALVEIERGIKLGLPAQQRLKPGFVFEGTVSLCLIVG
jgi:hypothetical protein